MVLAVYSSCLSCLFFFKQKTAYEMRISDWSSDVCSSDLPLPGFLVDLADRGIAQALPRFDHAADGEPEGHLGDHRVVAAQQQHAVLLVEQIGRASCRERVCQYV